MGRRRVPEIRFFGFDDDYELKTIGDLTENYYVVNNQDLKLQSYSISNRFGFVKQKELYKRGGWVSVADKSNSLIVYPKSFAYNSAELKTKAIGYYENKNPCLVSPMYVVFKTKNRCYDYWLWHWIRTDIIQRDVKKFKQGGVREYVRYNLLRNFSIFFPTIKEQQKVSELIKNIDNIINKSQRELQYIKEFRNELLNKMIVQERERERVGILIYH